MSHITQAEQGLKALDARQWDDALAALSKALLASTNPTWLLARSRALIGLKRYAEALEDANLAFHAAFDRSKRELLVEAQYRRAVAHFRLGQYANADCCCIYAMRLCRGLPAIEEEDPKLAHVDEHGFWTQTLQDARLEAAEENPFTKPGAGVVLEKAKRAPHMNDWQRASTMRIQCLGAMDKLPAGDAARKVTVSLRPERKEVADLTAGPGETDDKAAPEVPRVEVPRDVVVQDYQTNDRMHVSVFSKGVDAAELQVEFGADHVRLKPIVYPGGEKKEWTVRLYSQIDTAASTYKVTPRKVELCLVKRPAGRWPRLSREESAGGKGEGEFQELEALKAARKRATETADALEADSTGASVSKDKTAPGGKDSIAAGTTGVTSKPSAAAYPTSSRTGPKDWDKITADDDEEEAGGVNDFFKKLYSSGTDDQKRAMMKSFTESNGTTLSTDWVDVGKRTVGTSPPEGVEAKKW